MVYALFGDEESGRVIKMGLEPVKAWKEIYKVYNPNMRIAKRGWIKATAHVTEDQDVHFIPLVYQIDPVKILDGPKAENLEQVTTFNENISSNHPNVCPSIL